MKNTVIIFVVYHNSWNHENHDTAASFWTSKKSEKYQKYMYFGPCGSWWVSSVKVFITVINMLRTCAGPWIFQMFMSSIDLFLGKTTIADALVASNGIISQRLAGKVRFNTTYLYLFINHLKPNGDQRLYWRKYLKKYGECGYWC